MRMKNAGVHAVVGLDAARRHEHACVAHVANLHSVHIVF